MLNRKFNATCPVCNTKEGHISYYEAIKSHTRSSALYTMQHSLSQVSIIDDSILMDKEAFCRVNNRTHIPDLYRYRFDLYCNYCRIKFAFVAKETQNYEVEKFWYLARDPNIGFLLTFEYLESGIVVHIVQTHDGDKNSNLKKPFVMEFDEYEDYFTNDKIMLNHIENYILLQ